MPQKPSEVELHSISDVLPEIGDVVIVMDEERLVARIGQISEEGYELWVCNDIDLILDERLLEWDSWVLLRSADGRR